MKICFIVEGGGTVGLGHLARCYSLAQEFLCRGHDVAFMGRGLKKHARFIRRIPRIISIKGMDRFTVSEKAKHEFWLALRSGEYCHTIVDHYGIDGTFARQIQNDNVSKVSFIDDLNNRNLFPAHTIINQNMGSEKISYRANQNCRTLLGIKYCMIRPEIIRAAKKKPSQAAARLRRRVFVSFGGADPRGISNKVCKELQRESLTICVTWNPRIEKATRRKCIVLKHPSAAKYLKEIAQADFAVIAAGSTAWELCLLKKPFIAIAYTNNQLPVARPLKKIFDRFVFLKVPSSKSFNRAAHMIMDQSTRKTIINSMTSLVDGHGCARIAKHFLSSDN